MPAPPSPSPALPQLFFASAPGQESLLAEDARERGLSDAVAVAGGVVAAGGMREAMRANLQLRGASHVLLRIAAFRAVHLAQLDRRARTVPWADTLRPDVPVRVEASCRRSRIYHAGAAAERVAAAIRETMGAPTAEDAAVRVLVRIDDDLVTVSIDTSGEPLHQRGHKQAVARAPMRENMAALFLRQCGYRGDEPVLDPMCGSGTFVIEAAEIALGLNPGRSRSFAFEQLAGFDAAAWDTMRTAAPTTTELGPRFFGSDRDAGAIAKAEANAARAGVAAVTSFQQSTVSQLVRPEGPPGLVICNPPYGVRIGDREKLRPLYEALGATLLARFPGWRVGIVTTAEELARATRLPFLPPSEPVLHGGIRVRLWQTRVMG